MKATKNTKISKADWKTVKLGEALEFKRGYDLPHAQMVEGQFPVVGSSGIIGWHNEFTTEAPSITIGRSGSVGRPYLHKGKSWSHNTALYIKDFKGNDPFYLYYLLFSIKPWQYGGGSAVPTLNRNDLHGIPISLPPLPTQRKIAAVLGALDDKIENNRKICANLEAQAQALFKSWFVDFEPFGGKMPKDWKMGKLGDVAEITSGKRPPTRANEKDCENQYPLLGASCIMGYTSEFMYDEPILVTGRVGTHGIIQRSCEKCWPSDNTLVVKAECYEFAYQFLRNVDYSILNRGSTQPLITQSDLKGLTIAIPAEKVLKEYESRALALMAMWLKKESESRALVELRDALLPRLMSGELDVEEVAV